jgi:hypothetical protein
MRSETGMWIRAVYPAGVPNPKPKPSREQQHAPLPLSTGDREPVAGGECGMVPFSGKIFRAEWAARGYRSREESRSVTHK